MKTLTDSEAAEGVKSLTGWELKDGAVRRQFTFAGFPEAIAFVVRLGFAAESADHHPDIHLSYKRVTLVYVTHSAGGLTQKDLDGAASAGRLAASLGGA